eukprot:scaffold3305_cov328-Pinguiococcus_pyrenoidosus.AAC.8
MRVGTASESPRSPAWSPGSPADSARTASPSHAGTGSTRSTLPGPWPRPQCHQLRVLPPPMRRCDTAGSRAWHAGTAAPDESPAPTAPSPARRERPPSSRRAERADPAPDPGTSPDARSSRAPGAAYDSAWTGARRSRAPGPGRRRSARRRRRLSCG